MGLHEDGAGVTVIDQTWHQGTTQGVDGVCSQVLLISHQCSPIPGREPWL